MTSSIENPFASSCAQAAAALRKLDHILIAAHVNPDGDAIGALAAAGHILAALGKKFSIYLPGGMPAYLDFLTLPGPVCRNLADTPFAIQSALFVDLSQDTRLGQELAAACRRWPSVNIDHHICAEPLGSVANCVEPEAAATCQLMAYVADALHVPLQGDLAEAIGLGLLTDTGIFQHGNATAPVFALAARLSQNGLSLPKLTEKLQSGQPLRKYRLWGRLLERVSLAMNGKLACAAAYLRDFEETGAKGEDLEGFVEKMRKLEGVEIALLLKQIAPDQCKFSLRSCGDVDVETIAAACGGGGHKNAAGGGIDASPERALEIIMAVIAAQRAARA